MEGQKLMHRIEGERAKDETLRMGEPNPTFRASDEFRQVSIKVKDKNLKMHILQTRGKTS